MTGSRSSARGRSASRCSRAALVRLGRRRRHRAPRGARRRAARALRRRRDALEHRGRRRRGDRRDRRQAAGLLGAPRRDRPAVSAEQTVLGRSRDPDRADRGAPRRRCAGRARDAERAVDGARGHRRPRGRCARGRRAPAARRGRALAPRPRRPPPVGDGRRHRGVRLRPCVLRAPRGGHDRGGHPARPLARGLHAARRADDARHGEAAARREDAPSTCARPSRRPAGRRSARSACSSRACARRS